MKKKCIKKEFCKETINFCFDTKNDNIISVQDDRMIEKGTFWGTLLAHSYIEQ